MQLERPARSQAGLRLRVRALVPGVARGARAGLLMVALKIIHVGFPGLDLENEAMYGQVQISISCLADPASILPIICLYL
ncbi:MAG: hypothetical protein ACYDHX_15300 [Methanothrix sp.]